MSRPTVKIVDPDAPSEPLIIEEHDYDSNEHTLWSEREPRSSEEAPPEDASPEEGTGQHVQYTYATNGRFRVYVEGSEHETGVGKEDLQNILGSLGTSMQEAEEITDQ